MIRIQMIIGAFLAFTAPAAPLAQETALELELTNMDRLLYVISVDGNPKERFEGYAYIPTAEWERSEKKTPKTVTIRDIAPGRHTVTITAQQDTNSQSAQTREEFLLEYQPLEMEVDAGEGVTRQTIDLQSLPNRMLVQHRFPSAKINAWETRSDVVDGHTIEVRAQKKVKDGKIGRRARNRIYAKGQYKNDRKKNVYFSGEILWNGKTVSAFQDVPVGGQVEYLYWDFGKGEWLSESFQDNTLADDQPIKPLIRIIPVGEDLEMRLGAFGGSMGYTVLRLDR